jgi:hypothetical protein
MAVCVERLKEKQEQQKKEKIRETISNAKSTH